MALLHPRTSLPMRFREPFHCTSGEQPSPASSLSPLKGGTKGGRGWRGRYALPYIEESGKVKRIALETAKDCHADSPGSDVASHYVRGRKDPRAPLRPLEGLHDDRQPHRPNMLCRLQHSSWLQAHSSKPFPRGVPQAEEKASGCQASLPQSRRAERRSLSLSPSPSFSFYYSLSLALSLSLVSSSQSLLSIFLKASSDGDAERLECTSVATVHGGP